MKFMYGSPEIGEIVKCYANTRVFNFYSLREGFIELNLIPDNNLGAINEYDFDLKYVNWIFSDDQRFIQFMTPIQELFNGRDVFIVYDHIMNRLWEDNMMESLLKLIQTRYGIIPCKIEDLEDYETANESDIRYGYGLMNFDQDAKRFIDICEKMGGVYYGT